MNIKEMAMMHYEKLMQEQDTGDMIYCEIGALLGKIPDTELADQIDLLILKMSDADKQEYYIRGFEDGVSALKAFK